MTARFSLLRRGRLLLGVAAFAALAQVAFARTAAADIQVYEHSQFRGRGVTIGGTVPDLSAYGMNDQISSVRVFSGVWEICEHANFRGRCVTVNRDVYNLEQLGMNDRVSSIRPLGRTWGGYRGAK